MYIALSVNNKWRDIWEKFEALPGLNISFLIVILCIYVQHTRCVCVHTSIPN